MLAFCVVLIFLLFASTAAASYLYATHKANVRLISRQDRDRARLARVNAALLDRVLNRHGVAPITKPDDRPGPAQSFMPKSAWEVEWDEQEREDEERARVMSGIHASDLTDAQKAELKRRAEGAING